MDESAGNNINDDLINGNDDMQPVDWEARERADDLDEENSEDAAGTEVTSAGNASGEEESGEEESGEEERENEDVFSSDYSTGAQSSDLDTFSEHSAEPVSNNSDTETSDFHMPDVAGGGDALPGEDEQRAEAEEAILGADESNAQDSSSSDIHPETNHEVESGHPDLHPLKDLKFEPAENNADGEADIRDSGQADDQDDNVRSNNIPEWSEEAAEMLRGSFDKLRDRYASQSERYKGTEAFKTIFVLPMLNLLGYDVFNPDEVEPIESDQSGHQGYFAKHEGDVQFAVVMDASDIERESMSDIVAIASSDRVEVTAWAKDEDEDNSGWETVFTVNLYSDAPADQLHMLVSGRVDADMLSSLALGMRDNEDVIDALRAELMDPSTNLVMAIRQRLEAAGNTNLNMLETRIASAADIILNGEEEPEEEDGKDRVLTGEEARALQLIQEMCSPEIDASRISARPGQTYCPILLDDNNRKSLARLFFGNATTRSVLVFEGDSEKRHKIENTADITKYRDAIRDRAKKFAPDSFDS